MSGRTSAMKPISFRAEAAQFALLQRLAPSLRHRLMGIVHPIVLLAELAGRQISHDSPQIERTRETIGKLRQHAREVSAHTIGALAWITGEESQTVNLRDPGSNIGGHSLPRGRGRDHNQTHQQKTA